MTAFRETAERMRITISMFDEADVVDKDGSNDEGDDDEGGGVVDEVVD